MNLASLLNTSADEAKRPVPFNDGTYYGSITAHKFVESRQKKTPGVEYTIVLTHADDDVDLTGYDEKGEAVQLDPNGKEFRTTFWLTENSLFMLKEFIESCGLETSGRSFQELIPAVTGQPVIVSVSKAPYQAPREGFFNQIDRVVGAASQS
jgi:hypothetical protein